MLNIRSHQVDGAQRVCIASFVNSHASFYILCFYLCTHHFSSYLLTYDPSSPAISQPHLRRPLRPNHLNSNLPQHLRHPLHRLTSPRPGPVANLQHGSHCINKMPKTHPRMERMRNLRRRSDLSEERASIRSQRMRMMTMMMLGMIMTNLRLVIWRLKRREKAIYLQRVR